MQSPLPFPDFEPPLRLVKPSAIKSAAPSPMAFYFDGSSLSALKYRDGESHTSFGAWMSPSSGYREFSANENGYAQAYMSCVWAFRAINVLVQKVSEVLRRGEIVNKVTGDPIHDHLFVKALDLAYTFYQQDVYEDWLLSKALYGETYVELVSAFPIPYSVGVPRTVRVLNALGVEPIIQRGMIAGYTYDGDDGKERFAPDDVAFDKYRNPVDDVRGLSLLTAALDAVNIDRSLIIFTRAHLKNNARPGLIFTPKEGRLSQADVDLIQTTLSEDVKGAQNAGNPLLMPTAFDVTTAQAPSMEDLLGTTGDQAKRRICSAVGVPVALVDYTDMAFQLSPEQNKTFYELSVLPNAEKVARVINAQILPFFDPTRKSEFKLPLDNVRASLADPKARTEIADMQLRAGAITLNEYREKLDMKPTVDGNVRFLPMGATVVKEGMLGQEPALPAPVQPAPLLGAGNGNVEPAQPVSAPAVEAPPAPMGKAIDPDAAKELKEWRLLISRKGREYPFKAITIPQGVRDYIQVALADGDKEADVFAAARDLLADDSAKAYTDTRAAFVSEMVRLIGDGQKNAVSRQKFGGSMRSALRRYGLVAFRDGMNSERYDPESFSAQELAAFRAWQAEVSGYISGLGDELFKQAGITPEQVELRANMWADKSLREIYYKGAYFGAPNRLKKWVRNPLKDSCVDCIRRDGEIRAYADWEKVGLPGSSVLSCRGFFCGCVLENTDGTKSIDPAWVLTPIAGDHVHTEDCDHDHESGMGTDDASSTVGLVPDDASGDRGA